MKDSIYCDYPNCRSSDASEAMTVNATGGPFMRMETIFDHALCKKHYERLRVLLEKAMKPK